MQSNCLLPLQVFSLRISVRSKFVKHNMFKKQKKIHACSNILMESQVLHIVNPNLLWLTT
jgi:hypothetical protein